MAREPIECRYCASKRTTSSWAPVVYQCGTQCSDDWWMQSTECAASVSNAQSRIRRALDVLRTISRYDTHAISDADIWCGDNVDQAVDADGIDRVIQILEGGSDNPN